jgi:hypothetical protein
MDDNIKKELQSAAFERLISHLRERKDVQNIDLMNLAGFCRNCLSKWYREEAEKKGIEISDPDAREHVYGMPYSEWKEKYINMFSCIRIRYFYTFFFSFFSVPFR